MIDVERLNRRYGSLHAVKDVSFSIGQGEIIGLLGPNGAGKTTIMKMMCGFLEPSSGKVSINGADIREQTKLAQSNIGYLPENLPVYPEMTVVAYLEYAAGLKGIAEDKIPAEIRRAIDETDLREKAFSKISDLSRGLKQRVGVAQSLLGSPKVLVLDEPTNGLDPTQTLHMRDLIRRLAKNATVILSTHILSEVEAVCDRVLMVHRGELVLDSRFEDLKSIGDLVIRTNADVSYLENLVGNVAGVKKITVERENEKSTVKLSLEDHSQSDQLAATLASQIIADGHMLYQINIEKRDLESLFRELTTVGGVSNAA